MPLNLKPLYGLADSTNDAVFDNVQFDDFSIELINIGKKLVEEKKLPSVKYAVVGLVARGKQKDTKPVLHLRVRPGLGPPMPSKDEIQKAEEYFGKGNFVIAKDTAGSGIVHQETITQVDEKEPELKCRAITGLSFKLSQEGLYWTNRSAINGKSFTKDSLALACFEFEPDDLIKYNKIKYSLAYHLERSVPQAPFNRMMNSIEDILHLKNSASSTLCYSFNYEKEWKTISTLPEDQKITRISEMIMRNIYIYCSLDKSTENLSKNSRHRIKYLIKIAKEKNIPLDFNHIPLVFSRETKGATALIMAVKKGNEAIVKLLLEQKVNIELEDDLGNTALMTAINNGYMSIAELLLKQGATFNIKSESKAIEKFFSDFPKEYSLFKNMICQSIMEDFHKKEWRFSLLYNLIKYSPLEVFQQLYNFEGEYIYRKNGISLLDRIIQLDRNDLMALILEKLQKLPAETYQEYINLATLSALAADKKESFKMLLQAGAKVPTQVAAKKSDALEVYSLTSSKFFYKFLTLIEQGDKSKIEELREELPGFYMSTIKKGEENKDMDVRNFELQRLFLSEYFNANIIKLLLDQLGDAYFYYRNKEGISLLDCLIQKGQTELVELYIEKLKQNPKQMFNDFISGSTFFAISKDQNAILQILIDTGASIPSKSDVNRLGLNKVYNESISKIRSLIVDYVKNKNLDKLSELESKFSSLVKAAIQKINEENGNKLLISAAHQNNLPMIKWLLKNGASTNSGFSGEEFFDALQYGISLTKKEDISKTLEDYKQQLSQDDPSGEISNRITIENIFNETKKINMDLLQKLELKSPDLIKSIINLKLKGSSFLYIALQKCDLPMFQWLMNHGALFKDSMQFFREEKNEYNLLNKWMVECVHNDNLMTLKTIKECFSSSAFKEMMNSPFSSNLVIEATNKAAEKGNVEMLQFLRKSGANINKTKEDDLYKYIMNPDMDETDSIISKKMCNIIEYLGKDFDIDKKIKNKKIKLEIFMYIEICITGNDYDNLKRFKSLLSPATWKEFLNRDTIELMKKESPFNDKIKEILETDAKPVLTSYSGILLRKPLDKEHLNEPSNTPSTPKPWD